MSVGWKCRLKWRLATFFWFEEKLGQSIILKFVICYMYDQNFVFCFSHIGLAVILHINTTWGAFVWDQSGIRIIGIMQVSVCLGAILIPEYLDSILAILLPGAE